MKGKICILAVAILSMLSCATTQEQAERRAMTRKAVSESVEQHHWHIDVTTMQTLRYGARTVTPDFYLELRGDTVQSYLPYLGQAHQAPMIQPAQGLNFEAPVQHYQQRQTKAGCTQIDFDARTQEDLYHYTVDMFETGKASIRVHSQYRDPISFDGDMDTGVQSIVTGDYGYLYCHMSDRGEYTAYALSRDGYHYEDLLGGDAVMDPKVHARIEGGQRDAYVCRSWDGKGYVMVTTDMCVAKSKKWDNYGIDLLRSDDLINWQSVTFDYRQAPAIFTNPDAESVYKDWSTINRVWAPQIFWDSSYVWPNGDKGGYFIYYSMWNSAEEPYDRMYYSYANKSFTKLTQPKLLFDWGYATIDADINLLDDGLYHMLIKKEGGHPGIYTATSEHLTYGWGEPVEDDYVSFEGNKKCEGSSAFQLIGDKTWRVAYIQYSDRPKHYRICKADEHLRNFHDPVDIEGVTGPQHGSFLRLTKKEYKRLQRWSARHSR